MGKHSVINRCDPRDLMRPLPQAFSRLYLCMTYGRKRLRKHFESFTVSILPCKNKTLCHTRNKQCIPSVRGIGRVKLFPRQCSVNRNAYIKSCFLSILGVAELSRDFFSGNFVPDKVFVLKKLLSVVSHFILRTLRRRGVKRYEESDSAKWNDELSLSGFGKCFYWGAST